MYNEHQVATQGWHELAAYRDAFHQQVPGGDFETQSFASHHRQSIATWNRLDGRGQTIGAGTNGSRRPLSSWKLCSDIAHSGGRI